MKTYYAAALLAIVAGQAYADRASTTRYWDCSGGACGCGFGDPNKPVHCHSNAMFAAPAGNEHGAKFYGGAAISQQLGGGVFAQSACPVTVSSGAHLDVINDKALTLHGGGIYLGTKARVSMSTAREHN